MAIEIAIIGYSGDPPLQSIYLGLGLVVSLVAIAWLRQIGGQTRWRRRFR